MKEKVDRINYACKYCSICKKMKVNMYPYKNRVKGLKI
jgi:hypothetical protein